jgi:hypothetical protein
MSAVKKCGDERKARCSIHGRACAIPLSYDEDDSRTDALEAVFKEVPEAAESFKHGPDSIHICNFCIAERREARPPGYYSWDPIHQRMHPRHLIGQETQMRLDETRAKSKHGFRKA